MATAVKEAAETVVDNVTNALSNTSLTGKDENKDAVHASAAEGRRLYIGNLAYATTEGELKEFFKSYLVESVSIPKNPRTDRPVGYAFVDLSTPSEAERAIAELSGKEILERKVSVQLARTPQPAGEKTEGTQTDDVNGDRARGAGRGRGRGARGRAARGGRTRADEKEDAPAAEEATPAEETTTADTEAKKDTRPAKRERGPPADGVASKNKVMVANLPYDLTEEKLKELFKDFEPSSAKIALRPIPRFMIKKLQARGEARKGRGFGFVTLASEELQQKAVEQMNGKEIEGREIAVKVAIDSPDKTDEEANIPADAATGDEEEKASAAPSTTDATTSTDAATPAATVTSTA